MFRENDFLGVVPYVLSNISANFHLIIIFFSLRNFFFIGMLVVVKAWVTRTTSRCRHFRMNLFELWIYIEMNLKDGIYIKMNLMNQMATIYSKYFSGTTTDVP